MSDQKHRALIVDDEPQIRRFLQTSLTAHNYSILEAANGEEAITKAISERPDIVILDLGLPDIDGQEVLRTIRETSTVPVIILSVRGKESDKVQALDSGADDYVTKPFGIGELLARIRSVLRNRSRVHEDEKVYVIRDVVVDTDKRVVTKNGEEVKLTPKEYDLLCQLVSHPGKVLTHQYLLREIWGSAYVRETQYLRVYIGQLRQKIENDASKPELLLTEPGVGYRLNDHDGK